MNWGKTIFLAHASEDKPIVRKLYKRLIDEGLEPWLDEQSLEPGEQWDAKINEAIKKARFFLACISKYSVSKSGYIQKELRRALSELEKKVPDVIYFIPVLVEDVELPDITVGTIHLRDYQAVKIFTENGMQKLIDQLKKQANVIEVVKKHENVNFDAIRNSIANGKTESALKLLTEYAENQDSDLLNNIILLTSRYNKLKQDNLKGILTNDENSLENNRIVYSVLEIVKLLESESNSN